MSFWYTDAEEDVQQDFNPPHWNVAAIVGWSAAFVLGLSFWVAVGFLVTR